MIDTLSPAQKAAATRRANRAAAAVAPLAAPAGFADALGGAAALDDVTAFAGLLGGRVDVARALVGKFGSVAGVLAAPAELVAQIDAAAVAVIRCLRAAMTSALRNAVMGREALSSWSAVLDYVRAAQGFDRVESFRILFLDKRNHLIADEVQQHGTVDHVPVYPREVIKRALVLGATAVVLVHNHPSGDPTPSRADIQMTQTIIDIAKPLGIAVHDHIIVGAEGHTSMRGLKLI